MMVKPRKLGGLLQNMSKDGQINQPDSSCKGDGSVRNEQSLLIDGVGLYHNGERNKEE